MDHRSLEDRFLRHLGELGVGAGPVRLVVALSGGCDSVVLLHLLRLCARHLPIELAAAHLDHAMRAESADDASWVVGLCAAWEVPLTAERLSAAPRGETEARAARYRFLRRVASETGAALIATAHHADDQAETVLFRAVRGTGLRGLAGMRAISEQGVVRPLLPFWRWEIEAFARAEGLVWREDASNRSLDPVRNRIRHEILPLLERAVAPNARANLVALARLAGEAEAALERDADQAIEAVLSQSGEAIVLARHQVRDYDSATASRMLRKLLRRFGVVLTGTGTRTALQFITDAPSGRELQLPGGLRIGVEFDTVRIHVPEVPPNDEPLTLDLPQPGRRTEGVARIGGVAYRVRADSTRWEGQPPPEGARWSTVIPLRAVHFPVTLRSWVAGDRVETSGGTKTLKKLFGERRVPLSQRRRLPVLADLTGRVLWVAGVDRLRPPALELGEGVLILTILHD